MNKNNIAIIIGVLLVTFGLWQLFERVFGIFSFSLWRIISLVISILWPIAIIVGGALLMIAARKGSLDLPTNKKLFRSTKNKKICGVCGGIAEYLSVEPAIVRVVSIVLAILCWYVIIPLYILFWIIIPIDTQNYGTWV
jgi:phage shock protein PspC (stress-responsive transcriptional regulator)